MQIEKFHIYVCQIPFRFTLQHALHESSSVLSLFVKVHCDNGVVGFGEAVPRHYVTKETIASEFSGIKQAAILFVQQTYKDEAELMRAIREIKPFGAGQAALELALLDAGGKYFHKTIPQLLGRPVVRDSIKYSGGILHGSLLKVVKFALMMKKWGFSDIKVKVGLAHDFLVLLLTRLILGRSVHLRIDANGGWQPKEAINKIRKMKKWFRIEAAEQPTGLINEVDNALKLKEVSDAVDIPVMADESIGTMESARYLAKNKCCDMFNIRISKHGGILQALAIYDIAKAHGIGCQLGAHIGESGVLAAAGQNFASMVEDLRYAEGGGGGDWLFPEPIINENLMPGKEGKARIVTGEGLGITVNETVLKKYSLQIETVDVSTVREYNVVCQLLPKLYQEPITT
ncbi:mandelate racemase/muconate lactonizing enzyme family protein [Patescibacteria group bacterium]